MLGLRELTLQIGAKCRLIIIGLLSEIVEKCIVDVSHCVQMMDKSILDPQGNLYTRVIAFVEINVYQLFTLSGPSRCV